MLEQPIDLRAALAGCCESAGGLPVSREPGKDRLGARKVGAPGIGRSGLARVDPLEIEQLRHQPELRLVNLAGRREPHQEHLRIEPARQVQVEPGLLRDVENLAAELLNGNLPPEDAIAQHNQHPAEPLDQAEDVVAAIHEVKLPVSSFQLPASGFQLPVFSFQLCPHQSMIFFLFAMRKYPSLATTRTATRGHLAIARPGQFLRGGEIIASPETQTQYRIQQMLGEGGFGQVYLAARLGRSQVVPETVCIKASMRIDGWLREAYFGQLLDDHPRAIRMFDAFPLARTIGSHDGPMLYCLALEYAPQGDLSAFLARDGKAWTETAVRREMAGILQVLRKLHRGQLLHRDLTPLNVFVCDGRRLKLGDFGIVRQQSDRRGVTGRTMNALTAPSDILAGAAPKWQARDDVYQVGQLLGMLVKGDARARIRTADVRGLPCSDHLKEIIYRCIGERRKRYESADELIEALNNPPAPLNVGIIRTLEGVHLAFTGILTRRRSEAARAARRAGAIVHSGPSVKTTVVVRGRPNPKQAAGRDAGLKLMEIRRLREKGHKIILLDETRFWRLANRR